MISLWLLISLFTLVAAVVILFPLLHKTKETTPHQTQIEVQLYREQLAQLNQQLQSEEISQEEWEQSVAELEQSLLEDVPIESNKVISRQPSRILGVVLVIGLAVSAVGLYLYWGNSQALQQSLLAKEQHEQTQQAIAQYGSVPNIVAALKAKLQQDPNSAQGWYLLGKLYLDQQNWEGAVPALAKACSIETNNPVYLEKYAESLFLANNQQLTPQAEKIIAQVLQLAPNNINALNLIAFNAFHQGDYKTAIATWEKMQPLFAANSSDAQALQAMIDKAKAQMQQTGPQLSLKIEVAIAKSLLNKVSPNDTVFIYAKAVNGPPMPLAVQRRQVKDLPITVTLRQQDAMMPNLTLADFNQVKIIARISKSGQAVTQVGDIETESNVIDPRKQKNIIEINITP